MNSLNIPSTDSGLRIFLLERSLARTFYLHPDQEKYVNVPHPEREGGQEYGVFCASAAPVTIVEILSN